MSDDWIEMVQGLQTAKTSCVEKNFAHASKIYKALLAKFPEHAPVSYGLAQVAFEEGDTSKAALHLEKAQTLEPRNPHYLALLGRVYEKLFEYEKAISSLRKALKLNPQIDQESILMLLGILYMKLGRCEESIEAFEEALKIAPHETRIHYNYGVVKVLMGKATEAVDAFTKALEIDPLSLDIRLSLANTHYYLGEQDLALNEYKRCVKDHPDSLKARWQHDLFIPIIYNDLKEIKVQRELWLKNATSLRKNLQLKSEADIHEACEALIDYIDFYFAYPGGNVYDLHKEYGQLIHQIAAAKYPMYMKELPLPTNERRKIRIGFVGRLLFGGSINKTHGAWISELNHDDFEVHVFYLNYLNDQKLEDLKNSVDFFYQNGDTSNYDRIVQKIASENLDVIIYLDVGIISLSQFLASLRLAPLQCITLGHPISSGLPNVDYMLSSKLMEGPNAQKFYTEKLHCLSNLSAAYPYPEEKIGELPKVCRKKNPQEVSFLNLQSLFKLSPERDVIYVRIAEEFPSSHFYFIEARDKPLITEMFRIRLSRCFTASGLDVEDYCTMVPHMSAEVFSAFLSFGDIVLDSMDWSGYNTTMEACAKGKPVIHCPGETVRSRHTYAILKMLEREDLITDTVEDYIKLAVKLAKDPYLRESLGKDIESKKSILFDDLKPIRDLEQFLKMECNGIEPMTSTMPL
jgi:protein O-GlcNAc transferase